MAYPQFLGIPVLGESLLTAIAGSARSTIRHRPDDGPTSRGPCPYALRCRTQRRSPWYANADCCRKRVCRAAITLRNAMSESGTGSPPVQIRRAIEPLSLVSCSPNSGHAGDRLRHGLLSAIFRRASPPDPRLALGPTVNETCPAHRQTVAASWRASSPDPRTDLQSRILQILQSATGRYRACPD